MSRINKQTLICSDDLFATVSFGGGGGGGTIAKTSIKSSENEASRPWYEEWTDWNGNGDPLDEVMIIGDAFSRSVNTFNDQYGNTYNDNSTWYDLNGDGDSWDEAAAICEGAHTVISVIPFEPAQWVADCAGMAGTAFRAVDNY